MKLMRNNIFETNSSSTHSLTIYKREQPDFNDIPRNVDFYEIDEFGVAFGGDDSVSIHRIETECDKLSFMLNVCATVCDHRFYDDKMFIGYSWDIPNINERLLKYWEEMINSDIFTALKEAVYEVTGTTISFKRPNDISGGIPFYETISLDDENVEDIFHISEEFNKEDFKEFIKDVIFNKEVIIKDSSIPYGFEEAFD